jgi:hypothetical protein
LAKIEKGFSSDVYGDNVKQALEDLKEYNNKLIESLGDAEGAIDEVR